jgi:hypothetical protein
VFGVIEAHKSAKAAFLAAHAVAAGLRPGKRGYATAAKRATTTRNKAVAAWNDVREGRPQTVPGLTRLASYIYQEAFGLAEAKGAGHAVTGAAGQDRVWLQCAGALLMAAFHFRAETERKVGSDEGGPEGYGPDGDGNGPRGGVSAPRSDLMGHDGFVTFESGKGRPDGGGASPDPVFALIQAHDTIGEEINAVQSAISAEEKALGMDDWPDGCLLNPEYPDRYENHAPLKERRARLQELFDEHGAAADALLAARPSTEEGVRALALYGHKSADEVTASRILAVLAGLPDPDAGRWDEED